jgi:uncharacterized membrane protein
MKDKTLLIIQAILLGFIILGIVGFGIGLFMQGDFIQAGAIILVTIIAIALAYTFVLKKAYKDVGKGIPIQDERSKRMKEKASFCAFNLSLYWILGLMWYNGLFADTFNLNKMESEQAIMYALAGMLILFAVSYIWVSKRKNL